MLTDLKYKLDLTGTLPENRKTQTFDVGADGKRVFASKLGPFFTDNCRLASKMNPTVPLVRGTDFEVLYFYPEISKKAKGAEIGAFIIFNETVPDGQVDFVANHVGGPFVNQYELLVKVIEDLQLDSREVEFSRIEGFPGVLEAASHLQDIGDIFGFEYITSMLSELVSVISQGSTAQASAILTQLSVIEDNLRNAIEAHTDAEGNVHKLTAHQVGTYDSTQLDLFFNEIRASISTVSEMIAAQAEELAGIAIKIISIEDLFKQHVAVLTSIREDMTQYDEQMGQINEMLSQFTLDLEKLKGELETTKVSLQQNWNDHTALQRGIDNNTSGLSNANLILADHEVRIVNLEELFDILDEKFDEFKDYANIRLEGLDYRVTQLEINGGGSGNTDPGVIKKYDFGIDINAKDTYAPGTYPITVDNIADFNLDKIKGIVHELTRSGVRFYSDELDGERMYFDILEISYGGSGDVGFFQTLKVRAGHELDTARAYFDYGHAAKFPLALEFDNTGMVRDNAVDEDVTINFSKVRLYGKRPRPLEYYLNLPSTIEFLAGEDNTALSVAVANATKYVWERGGNDIANSNDDDYHIGLLGPAGTTATFKVTAFNDDGESLASNNCVVRNYASVPSGKYGYDAAATIVFEPKARTGNYSGNFVDEVIVKSALNGMVRVSPGVYSYTDGAGEAVFRVTNVTYNGEGKFVSATIVPELLGIHSWNIGDGKSYAHACLVNNLEPKTVADKTTAVMGDSAVTIFIKSNPDLQYTYQDVAGMCIDVELASDFYYTIDGEEFNTHNMMDVGWHKAHQVKGLVDNSTFADGISYDSSTSIISGEFNEEFELQLRIGYLMTMVPELGEGHSRLYIEDIRIVPTNGQSRYSLVLGETNNDYRTDRPTLYGTQTRNYHRLTERPVVNNDVVVNSQNVTATNETFTSNFDYTINARCAIPYTVKWYVGGILKKTEPIDSGYATNRNLAFHAEGLETGANTIEVELIAGTNTETLTGTVNRVNAPSIVTPPQNIYSGKINENINLSCVINAKENVYVDWYQKKSGATDYTRFKRTEYAGQEADRTVSTNFTNTVEGKYDLRVEVVLKADTTVKIADEFACNLIKELTVGGSVNFVGITPKTPSVSVAEFNHIPLVTADVLITNTGVNLSKVLVDGVGVDPTVPKNLVKGQTYRIGVEFPRDNANHTVGFELNPGTINDTDFVKYLGEVTASRQVSSIAYTATPSIVISGDDADSDVFYFEVEHGANFTPSNEVCTFRLVSDEDGVERTGVGKTVQVQADGRSYTCHFDYTFEDPEGGSYSLNDSMTESHIASKPKFSVVSYRRAKNGHLSYTHWFTIRSNVYTTSNVYLGLASDQEGSSLSGKHAGLFVPDKVVEVGYADRQRSFSGLLTAELPDGSSFSVRVSSEI